MLLGFMGLIIKNIFTIILKNEKMSVYVIKGNSNIFWFNSEIENLFNKHDKKWDTINGSSIPCINHYLIRFNN